MWYYWLFVALTACLAQEDDYIPPGYEVVTSTTPGSFGSISKCGEGDQQGRYLCVPYHRCDGDTNRVIEESQPPNTNGINLIDIRFGANACLKTLDVCCQTASNGSPTDPGETTGTTSSTSRPPTPRPTSVPTPVGPSFCGIRNENGIDFKIKVQTDREAEYGEFPWMVAVLRKDFTPKPNQSVAICGGSLLAPNVVLTGAHCVESFKAGDIKIRAGEWDTQTTNERLPFQERNVKSIIIHENYKPHVLFNDFALLILQKPLKKAEHIGTVCLPNQNQVIDSTNCYATGWGKDKFDREGIYQVILKKIELPMVDHNTCQQALRKTRLGEHFKLDASFTCAGGKLGQDTCTGDGGSPLVCPDPNNPKRYVQTGIVAWGIGCGEEVPGVYADVTKAREWIDQQLAALSITSDPYVL